MSHNFDVLVVGAGFAGSVLAERFASIGKKVRILEKRPEIAGNMYDYMNDQGVLVHHFGPHLFHTNSKRVVDYLSQFTQWHPYEHKVLGYVVEKVPIHKLSS
jgi:UDP-galactopyranose mutase